MSSSSASASAHVQRRQRSPGVDTGWLILPPRPPYERPEPPRAKHRQLAMVLPPLVPAPGGPIQSQTSPSPGGPASVPNSNHHYGISSGPVPRSSWVRRGVQCHGNERGRCRGTRSGQSPLIYCRGDSGPYTVKKADGAVSSPVSPPLELQSLKRMPPPPFPQNCRRASNSAYIPARFSH